MQRQDLHRSMYTQVAGLMRAHESTLMPTGCGTPLLYSSRPPPLELTGRHRMANGQRTPARIVSASHRYRPARHQLLICVKRTAKADERCRRISHPVEVGGDGYLCCWLRPQSQDAPTGGREDRSIRQDKMVD